MNRNGLAKNEEKIAYMLLLPAFILLIVVAFFPLMNVFYTSLTNKGFATGEETSFIGFKNYKNLLSFTIKELPPINTVDSDTGETVQQIDADTGEVAYESAVNILPREPVRYKELTEFNLFGKKYVIGATDPKFLRSIFKTLQFAVLAVFFETILGLIIALVVNSNFKARGLVRAVMLIPWAIIAVVSAKIWNWMLEPSRVGLFNTILDRIGIGSGHISFLGDKALIIPSMVMIDVWKNTPFVALILLAGLQVIPQELYEAASIDGANKINQFFYITLPNLKGSLAIALIFRTLDALRIFDLFQVLLGDREYSMATYNYFQLIGNRDMGYSSAIGVVIFIMLFGFAIIYIKALGVRSSE